MLSMWKIYRVHFLVESTFSLKNTNMKCSCRLSKLGVPRCTVFVVINGLCVRDLSSAWFFEPIKSFRVIKVNSGEISKKNCCNSFIKTFEMIMKFDFESMEIQVQSPHQGKKCISPRNNDHIKTIGPRFQFTTRVKRIKGPWLCEHHPNVNEFDEYERCADRKNQFISLSLSPRYPSGGKRRPEGNTMFIDYHAITCQKGPGPFHI